jgi:branched-chain amino acid aminotransferase
MSINTFRLEAGRVIPLDTDATSPDELTRRLPRGLYTTFSTNHNGTHVLGLTTHLDRLYIPAQSEGTHPSTSRMDLRLALTKIALDSTPGESRFRLLLSASDGMLYVIVQPFPPLPREIYEKGVKVITADLVRNAPRRKDSNFIIASQAERSRIGKEIYEVLLTHNGRIYEGMTSNFYAIVNSTVLGGGAVRNVLDSGVHGKSKSREIGSTLLTSRYGILLGVTRRAVLRLARGQGMFIQYRAPRLNESFAEAFITSSSRGIVPVVSIDDRGVGERTVGTWTRRLIQVYRSYVQENSEPIKPPS